MEELSTLIRVFRRNAKNMILIWESHNFNEDFCKKPVAVFRVDGNNEYPVTYSKFVPEDQSKFPSDIDGVVIGHIHNNLDKNAKYDMKLVFGHGMPGEVVILKEVKPYNTFVPIPGQKDVTEVHVFAYDYKNRKWVPMPVDHGLMIEGDK